MTRITAGALRWRNAVGSLPLPLGNTTSAFMAMARSAAAVPAPRVRSALGRLVFGSVADEVLRKTPAPVLLVRSGTDASDC